MEFKVKNLAILQARMTSSRLPGKVMMPINNVPMIHWQISRLSHSSGIDKLVVATSTDPSDDILASYLEEKAINVHRGPLSNVYQRFLDVINQNPDSDVIIRLTGDCPMVMPKLIDEMLEYYAQNKFDYLSNCLTPSFPDGLDIEIFSRQSFISLLTFTLANKDLEHVTLIFIDPKALNSLKGYSEFLKAKNLHSI
jgi:spore coat polysaccharide biosynthesis protein SpsF (cytidylyltransferase family)